MELEGFSVGENPINSCSIKEFPQGIFLLRLFQVFKEGNIETGKF